MSVRALVTGANGFVGQWLVAALLERGVEVHGLGSREMAAAGLLGAGRAGAVTWHAVDIRDGDQVAAAVAAARPDQVFHLAGISHVPEAQSAPVEAYDVNVLGLVRILHAIRLRVRGGEMDPRVLVVGSGEQYGRHEQAEMPLAESADQRPLTVYAASKAAQELVALQAFHSEGLHVIATRSFNHSGVGHGRQFLLPSLVARALALPRAGGVLTIGNASVVRDFLHVSDVVAAYLSLMAAGTPGRVYNVCSGRGLSVRELADAVLRTVGIAAEIQTSAELLRPVDVPILVGSPARLRRATGWAPRRAVSDIIADLINAATSSPTSHAETH